MKRALDVYAMTNPALCGLVIWSFLDGHGTTDNQGAEFPLLFLPIPLILSDRTREKLLKTNARTNFHDWVQRNPEIVIGLDQRIERTALYTREAILFASRYRLISGDSFGSLHAENAIKRNQLNDFGDELRLFFNLARRLGIWISNAGPTRIIFHSLGLTL